MLGLGACKKERQEPTAGQAEQSLKSHIQRVVEDSIVVNARVTDPGKSTGCSAGKEKRSYAVAAEKKNAPELTPVELSRRVLGSIDSIGGYESTYLKGGDPTTRLHNAKARTNLTILIPSKGHIEIHGSTDCSRGQR
jgi:hypothetical protein